MKKRILSFVLAVALLLSNVSAVAATGMESEIGDVESIILETEKPEAQPDIPLDFEEMNANPAGGTVESESTPPDLAEIPDVPAADEKEAEPNAPVVQPDAAENAGEPAADEKEAEPDAPVVQPDTAENADEPAADEKEAEPDQPIVQPDSDEDADEPAADEEELDTAPAIPEEEEDRIEEGFAVTFISYDSSVLGVYTTDTDGYLQNFPQISVPENYVFIAWAGDFGPEGAYMLTTAQSDWAAISALGADTGYVFTSLSQYRFAQDANLYLTVLPVSDEAGIEVLSISDINNSYKLTIPVTINGTSVNVTLDARLQAEASADLFSTAAGLYQVEASSSFAASVIKMTVAGKDSATYTVSVAGSDSSAYNFTVQIIDNVNVGGPKYTVTFADTNKYTSSDNSVSGKFEFNDDQQKFLAAAEAGKLSTSELMDFTFSVNWSDNNNPSRPTGAASYTLYAGGALSDAVAEKVSESYNTTKYSFPNLPKFDAQGNLISYTVQETLNAQDYIVVHGDNRENTSIGNGETIMNLLTEPIQITKIWYDGENGQNKRPDVETWAESLTLYRSVNAEGGGSTPFTAAYNNGVVTFTDASTGDTITASVSTAGKDWVLTTQKVECFADDGEMYVYYFQENAAVWENTDGNGDHYVQTIRNDNITASEGNIYNGDAAISLLENTEDFVFHKIWNDKDAADEDRPTLTFYLYRYARKDGVKPFSGSPVSGKDNIEIIPTQSYGFVDKTDSNDWEITYASDLPKYDDEGYPYVYYILEDMSGTNAELYTSKVDNTNSVWHGEVTSEKYLLAKGAVINGIEARFAPAVTKKWETGNLILPGETRTINATFVLEKLVGDDWEQVGEPLTISDFTAEQSTKMAFFPDVDQYDAQGREITYRIRETQATFLGAANLATVNYAEEWNGPLDGGVQMDPGYTGEFTSGGYQFATTYSLSNGELLVTNTLETKKQFGIHKEWTPALSLGDGESAYIKVRVFQDNQPFDLNQVPDGLSIDKDANITGFTVNSDGTLTISCTGDFNLVMLNLPKYDAAGKVHYYTAREIECTEPYVLNSTSYAIWDTYEASTGRIYKNVPAASFANTSEPESQRLAVQKIWKGANAAQSVKDITVGVYHVVDGVYTLVEGSEQTLNAANSWYKEILFEPVDDDEDLSHYVIREITVDGGNVSYSEKPEWLLDAAVRPDPSMESGTGYAASDSKDGYYWQVTTNKLQDGQVETYQIANLWVGYVNMVITKTWQAGTELMTGDFTVFQNGTPWIDFSITADGELLIDQEKFPDYITVEHTDHSLTIHLKNFPKYDENGQLYTYVIKEVSVTKDGQSHEFIDNIATVDGKHVISSEISDYNYGTDYNSGDLMSSDFDNRINNDLGIRKSWTPALFPEDWEGEQVAFITVRVLLDDRPFDLNTVPGKLNVDTSNENVVSAVVNSDGTLTITCTGDFNLAILDMPGYARDGRDHRYTIEEVSCSLPYVPSAGQHGTEGAFTVSPGHTYQDVYVTTFANTVNDPDDGNMRLAVEKVWKNTEASRIAQEITVGVYHVADNAYTLIEGTQQTLSDRNNWRKEIFFTAVDEDTNIDNYVVRELTIDGGSVNYSQAPSWLLDAAVRQTPSMANGTGYAASGKTEGFYWQTTTKKLDDTPITTYQITNLWVGYVNLEVSKTWKIGADLLSGSFTVLANNTELFTFSMISDGTVEIDSRDVPQYIAVDKNATATSMIVQLKNFPKYDDEGHIISYAVQETSIVYGQETVNFDANVATVDGKRLISSVLSDYTYGKDYHSDDWMSAAFANSYMDSSPLEVYKVWRDGNIEIVRPDISLTLMRKSMDPAKESLAPEVMITDCKWNTKLNSWLWKSTFDDQDFPMYDENGYDYLYYVQEEVITSVPGWAKGYYDLVAVEADLHSEATTTEDTFATPTADATSPYAVAQYIKLQDSESYEAGVVLNYLAGRQKVEGQKIWANLPAWYRQSAFGDVYLGIFRYTPAKDETPDSAQFMSSVTLSNGASAFSLDGMQRYSEYGYPYQYHVKELLPAGNTSDSSKQYVESVDGTPITENGHYWEICESAGKTYRGYRVTYSGSAVTNTYTGAPYVSFNATKVWDLSKYLNDYPDIQSIDYPTMRFTLTAQMGGSLSHREDVATLDIPGGTITKQPNDTWTASDSAVKVNFDAVALTISVSVSGNRWVSIPGATCQPIINAGVLQFPTYGPNGVHCTYFITEATVNGYTLTEKELNEVQDTSSSASIEIGPDAFDLNENSTVAVSFKNVFKETGSKLIATKIWNDQGNKFNTRPNVDRLSLNLYQNDELIYSSASNPYYLSCQVTQNQDNTWSYTFSTTENTPSSFRFPDVNTTGSAYTYRVEEVFSDGAKAISYGTVAETPFNGSSNHPSSINPTITNNLLTKNVRVDKEWVDQTNKALTLAQMAQLKALGYMPDSVEFQVFYKSADGSYLPFKDHNDATFIYTASWEQLYQAVSSSIMLTVARDLPVFDADGNSYEYIAKEIALNFGNQRVEVVYSDNLTGTFSDSNGLFTGTVVTPQSGYSLISNKMNVKKLTFVKYWDDDNNRDSYRPTQSKQYSITLVNETGETTTTVSTLPVSGNEWTIEQNGTVNGVSGIGVWTYVVTVPNVDTFRAFENMDASWAAKYAPTADSVDWEDDNAYLKSDGDTHSITNKHEPDTISIPVTKEWKGDSSNAWGLRRPITLWLTQNNSRVITYLQTGLPTYEVTYSGDVTPPDAQTTSGTNVALTQDSTVILQHDHSENATVTWMNLPRYQPKTPEKVMDPSVAYIYQVNEAKLNGYKNPGYSKQNVNAGSVSSGVADAAKVTNTLNTMELKVSKSWQKDFQDAFDSRGGVSLVFLLKQNNAFVRYIDGTYSTTETGPAAASDLVNYIHQTLTVTDTGEKKFTNLPVQDSAGQNYTYSIAEYIQTKGGTLLSSLSGYESSFANSVVTNTLTTTTTLSVDKTWVEDAADLYKYDGVAYRPQSIEFTVYYKHVGTACADSVTDGWHATGIKGYAIVNANDPQNQEYTLKTAADSNTNLELPATSIDGGCTIVYKAVESAVIGYTGNTPAETESAGDAAAGFTTAVTNTQKTTKLTAQKVWAGEYDSRFREEITLTVQYNAGSGWKDLHLQEGDGLVTMTLNAGNRWTDKVEQLLYQTANETPIQYRVVEDDVPSGYTVTYGAVTAVQGNAEQNGYEVTVTNTMNSLNLSKTVVGGDPNAAFTFQVDVTGDVSDRAYPYSINLSGDTRTRTVVSGGTIELKGGQTVTIYGIANGAQVTITEVGAKKGNTSIDLSKAYTTTVNDAKDTVWTTQGIQTVSTDVNFENTYVSSGSLSLAASKTLYGAALQDGLFAFTIYDKDGRMLETVHNNLDGTIPFSVLTYNQDSVDSTTHQRTYTYAVAETGIVPDGYTFDERVYTVTVHVEDHLDGTITATPTYTYVNSRNEIVTVNGIIFANTYNAVGSITIEGSKSLDGRPLVADEFEFELLEDGSELKTVKNDANGRFFIELNYAINPGDINTTNDDIDDTGLHTYTLKEVKGSLGGVDYDKQEITIRVQVSDNGDGTLKAVFVNEDLEPIGQPLANFGNIYRASGSITINGSKILNGRVLKASEFSFELLEDGEVIQTAQNAANGSFSIVLDYAIDPDKEIEDTGLYTYTLREAQGSLSGVTYDEHEVTFSIQVKDNGDGTLRVKFVDSDLEVVAQPAAVFTNTYEAEGSIVLTAKKRLVGKKLEAGQFTFGLYDAEGKLLQSVTNDADGRIVFAPLTYDESDILWEDGKTKAEIVYTVSEIYPQRGDFVYDKTVYTVKVTVSDLADGTLDVRCKFLNKNVAVAAMEFVNRVPIFPLSPKTGDDFNLTAWLLVQIASFAAICVGLVARRRKKAN